MIFRNKKNSDVMKNSKAEKVKPKAKAKVIKIEAENKAQVELRKKRLQEFKDKAKTRNKETKTNSKNILKGLIVSTMNKEPKLDKYIIELFGVSKSYFSGDMEYQVLKNIDLKIKKGNFVVILGPSGSGKTTLLNIISGLDKADEGDVFVSGYNLSLLKDSHLTKFRRDVVGFIFQQYNLLPNLNVLENAEVGENLAKIKNQNMSIEDIFEVIEMDAHMKKFPSQLSGGQQQRVSIGRALAKNPTILFCDEPTGALDEEMGRKVLKVLLDVNEKYKTTIVMVTHNPNFQYVADTVIRVKNGKIDEIVKNTKKMSPEDINWA